MKSTRSALVAGAALSMLIATGSFAQPAPGPAGPDRPGAMAKRHHHDPEARAKHLRDTLQLRADQEPALQAFLGSKHPPEGARDKMRGERKEMAGLTTPERLDRQAARMAERQAAFTRRADATKRFYAALSPSQQKAFDAMHKGHGGKMGKRMGRMHGGG